MLPPIVRRDRGWLSEETLARERKRFCYGMRNQYIKKSPPVHDPPTHARHVRGVYAMTAPRQFLTRKQARFVKSDAPVKPRPASPCDYKIVATPMRRLSALRPRESIDGAEWTRSFQAGVWFWTNDATGESTAVTPEHLRRNGQHANPATIDDGATDFAGTGSLVYDSRTYQDDFAGLFGGGGL